MRKVDLSGRDGIPPVLIRAVLNGADLSDANLNGADLRGADLSYTTMARTYLGSAILNGASMIDIQGCDDSGRLPSDGGRRVRPADRDRCAGTGSPHLRAHCREVDARRRLDDDSHPRTAIGAAPGIPDLLLMAMALAVVIVACEGAVGKAGEPGPAGEAAKQPPYVVLELSALPDIVEGASVTADLSGAFDDPDGTAAALTLSAESKNTAIAMASVSGTTLTVTAVKVGNTVVVVTATDADSLSVKETVGVNVIPAPPPPEPPVTIADVIAKYPSLVITPTTMAEVSKEIELPADHTLISEDSTVVTVAQKAAAVSTPTASIQWASATADDTMAMNVWVVTAVKQGITNVDVLDKSGASVHTIRVRVAADPPPDPVPPVAPTVKAGGIGPQTLYLADSPMDIVLAGYFTHSSAISYAVTSSPPGVVDAVEANGTLTLIPLVTGPTRVSVVATADGESTAPVVFTVTVKAGSKPTPTTPDPDPPARNGSIMAQEVEVGTSTAAIDASEYFTPATGLTFTASSSAMDKARAAVSGSNLTITGIAVGSATVTVTATDVQNRSATQTIAVTVTAAGAIYKPSTVIIDGVTKMKDVSIDAGQTLQSLAIGTVTAAKKLGSDTVWTLTGEKKGTAMVRIWNADRTLDKTISVTVENTAPMKKKDAPVGRLLSMANDGSQLVDKDGMALADDAVTSEKRQYHKINLPYSEFFEDPDTGDLGANAYMAESNEPYIKVVEVLSSGVVIDVTKDVGSSFPLVAYVVDKTGAMSEKVTLTAPSPAPRADKYEVTQSAGDGDFSTATVYLREGVDHTLTFAAYATDGTASGFRFVSVFETEELPKTGVSVVSGTAVFVAPNPVPDASSSSVPYYTVSKTGPVELVEVSAENPKGLQNASDVPTLTFRVTDSGRATVTITYNVAVDLDGTGDGTAHGWKKDSETLTMSIVSSS